MATLKMSNTQGSCANYSRMTKLAVPQIGMLKTKGVTTELSLLYHGWQLMTLTRCASNLKSIDVLWRWTARVRYTLFPPRLTRGVSILRMTLLVNVRPRLLVLVLARLVLARLALARLALARLVLARLVLARLVHVVVSGQWVTSSVIITTARAKSGL